MPAPQLPNIAIIGRTNVGKSTLFNKLIEEQKSLVSDVAGTTRDRFEAECLWRGGVVRLTDTGGLDVDRSQEIENNIVEQTEMAIAKADVVLFVVDVNTGPLPDDLEIAKRLFAAKKPVVVVGNKADNPSKRRMVDGPEWRSWPLAAPIPVSAGRSIGLGDLLDVVYEKLEVLGLQPIDPRQTRPIRIGVFGEPNVGKSTLLNALLGEKRFITSSIAHTTRQPNDVDVEWNGSVYRFVDTAGVRRQNRRNKMGTFLEKHGAERTIELLKALDVVLFVVDVTQPVTAQDKHLAGLLAEHSVGVVIIANKWDLVPDKETNTINRAEETLRGYLPQLDYAPIVFTSALSGQRVQDIMEAVMTVFANRFTELSDEEAKIFISRAVARHKPSKNKGTWHPKILSFKQTHTAPPRFELVINLPREDALAPSYVRFLEHLLREYYDFSGTPIRVRVKATQKKHGTARQ